MTNDSTRPRRAFALDFLRISLCIGVVFYHYSIIRPASGPFMVIGFFVLSGFLLGTAFSRIEILDSAVFYSQKSKRFLPILIAALLFSYLFKIRDGEFLPPENFNWVNFSLPSFLSWLDVPAWYMGVEILLLLSAPFFFWLYKTRHGILLFFIGSALFSCFLFSQVPYAAPFGKGLYFAPMARCWQFVAGLLAAQLIFDHYGIFRIIRAKFGQIGNVIIKRLRIALTYFMSAAFVILWFVVIILKQKEQLHCWNYTFSFDVLCTIFFMLFIPLIYIVTFLFNHKTAVMITYVAELTYPIYLLHVPVFHSTARFMGKIGFPNVILTTTLSVILSIIGALILLQLQKKYIR